MRETRGAGIIARLPNANAERHAGGSRLNPAVGQFRDVLLLLNRLKTEGVIHDYAVGGAVAVSLWAEPVATQDLDVIVTVAGDAHPPPRRPTIRRILNLQRSD